MLLRDDISKFLLEIPKDVTLVAATKYVTSNDMKELLKYKVNNFGENRVEAFLEKYNDLKNENIIWHFIGHLQRNKAKDVINKIDYLHSLDSLKLAKLINDERTAPLNCFIEVNINYEAQKNGVLPEDIENFVSEILKYHNINLIGLMMMSVKESNDKYNQFIKLNEILSDINTKFHLNLKCLSMGMSSDYIDAIKANATHIRLGRILWKM